MKVVGTKDVSRVISISVFFVVLLFRIAGISALAQNATGTILGTVVDPSRAAIPDATVTIQNTETGLTRTTTTDAAGGYQTPSLPVGAYTIKIEKTGFETLTLQDITLTVSQSLTVNGTLQVGATSQEVTVTGAASLVDTTTAALSGLVNSTSIGELPLNGRSYTDLMLLQPGIQQSLHGSGSGEAGVYYSSNGASVRSNYATLDGTPVTNQLGGGVSSMIGNALGIGGIAEFRVVTTGFGAEYGHSAGSQMVLVSKSGSNQFHGDAFDYLRNSVMDARNFFDTPANSGGHRLPEFQRNNFGGDFGGPIRKDKTFFYATFEGVRENEGLSVNDVTFPAACHTANNIVTSSCVSTLGASQTITVAPVMQPLLALYPAPNTGSTTGYAFGSSYIADEYHGQIRADETLSTKDTFFARYTADNSQGTAPSGFGGGLSVSVASFPGYYYILHSRYQFLTLGENHVFSPNLLADTHLFYSRTSTGVHYYNTLNLTGPDYSMVAGYPIGGLSVTGYTSYGPDLVAGGPPGPPDLNVQNTFGLSEDVYDTIGKHALQFGALVQRYNQGMQNDFDTMGVVSFPTLAAFMEGLPTTETVNGYNAPLGGVQDYWYNYFGFYLQDTWHATPRLTLDLGLRYEFHTQLYDRIPSAEYGLVDYATMTAATPGPPMDNPSLKNFSPRLGFAYDVFGNGKMAIRSAFGIYYDTGNVFAALEQYMFAISPDNPEATASSPGLLTLPLTFPASDVGTNWQSLAYNVGQPKTYQYNLSVQSQLPGQMALTIAYVGSHGMNLYQEREANPIFPTSTSGYGPTPIEYWNPALVEACGNVVPSCRRNPNFGTMFLVTTDGYSWYNSLQATITRQLARGLEFSGHYTYSKTTDSVQGENSGSQCLGGEQAPGDALDYSNPNDYGPSCFNQGQNFNISMLYHFPNLQSHSFASKILNGWWVGSIITAETGFPVNIMLTENRSCDDGCLAPSHVQITRPNINTTAATAVINGKTYNFVPYNKSTVTTGNPAQFFNPLMFSLGPVGYLGTAGKNMLTGPGLTEWDFSASKDTALPFLGEAGAVEFRAEFFNMLNHANFSQPNGTAYTGLITDTGAYSEAPNSTFGQITSTAATSRQIQLSLRIKF